MDHTKKERLKNIKKKNGSCKERKDWVYLSIALVRVHMACLTGSVVSTPTLPLVSSM